MQTTLLSLYEMERSIPSQFSIDFDAPKLSVTRTSASLYLMLYQAIILCIRPFILQRVKDRIQSSRENRPAPVKSPPMTRLCVSCRQAAIKSIRILSALRQDKSNGKYLEVNLYIWFLTMLSIIWIFRPRRHILRRFHSDHERLPRK